MNLFTAIRLEAHKSTPIHKDQKEEASVIKKLINPKSEKKMENQESVAHNTRRLFFGETKTVIYFTLLLLL